MRINIDRNNQFELATQKHGIIKFDDFTVWRADLIDKYLSNIKELLADDVVLIIAKYNIQRIEDIEINDYEDKDKFNLVKLSLTQEELREFATKFLDENKYLLGQEDDRFTVSFGDGEEHPLELDKELSKHKWPENPNEKLKEAWLIQRKKQEEFIRKTLGLSNIKASEGIAEYARKQNDLIYGITKPLKMPPITTPIYNQKIQESIRSIKDSENRIRKHRTSVDAATLSVPDLIEELIKLQREMFRTSTKLQKAANESLDTQIMQAQQDSNSAGKQSKIAIIIALFTLILTLIFGFIQTCSSPKPNKQLIEVNDTLKQISQQNRKIINAINCNTKK